MNKAKLLDELIAKLLAEYTDRELPAIPAAYTEKQRLFRALVNIRPPGPCAPEFLALQDAYLQAELRDTGITAVADLPVVPSHPQIAVWQGDITTLQADAIVNAANSALLGCFVPCHGCIDNAIHTYAGVQLRQECDVLMQAQGHAELTGTAKITKAYNLPSRYVLHTVGPIVSGPLTAVHRRQLASCYQSCLRLAAEHQLSSVAFCCISTGEFHFPPDQAAAIAVHTVCAFLREYTAPMEVVFNVFKESDAILYNNLLGGA